MPVKLSQWGNSYGLRISRDLAERAALEVGDYVYIRLLDSGDILVRPVKPRDVPAGYLVPEHLSERQSYRTTVKDAIEAPW
ncbi:hypothetical protein EGT07_07860 [Herbaspirillum sp. HC18]|nr:hypothetical protein EGT07_07860 [Herbaspirillum sp. HC18]